MKKNDVKIIVLGLFVSALLYGALFMSRQMANTENLSVEVYMEGELIRTIPLSEEDTYRFEHDYGVNTFEIIDGRVDMIYADCPDLSCTRVVPIELPNENIVCLPYKFHIIIVGESEREVVVDAISQ